MSARQSLIGWLSVAACLAALGVGLAAPGAKEGGRQTVSGEQPPPAAARDPATLLPAGAALYVGWDGEAAHAAALKQTAAHEALTASGLTEAVEKFTAELFAQASGDIKTNPDAMTALAALRRVHEQGLSLSITLPPAGGPPLPRGVIVLHDAAGLEPGIAVALKRAAGRRVEFITEKRAGRTVTLVRAPGGPPVDLAWWVEGPHLVAAFGFGAIDAALATADGTAKDITTDRLWTLAHADTGGAEVGTVLWLDTAAVFAAVGPLPVPLPGAAKPVTVADLLAPSGADGVKSLLFRAGTKGPTLWSETRAELAEQRHGLLALADGATPITLADLPPLPAGQSGFTALSVDAEAFYSGLLEVIRGTAALGPPREAKKLREAIDSLPNLIGVEPREALLKPLGHVVCLYLEENQSALLPGFVKVVSVEDAATLRASLATVGEQMSQRFKPSEFRIRHTPKHGRDVVTLEIVGAAFNPSYVVTDDWFAVAISPQSIESFLLRLDGKLPRWEPTGEYATAMKVVPDQFLTLTVSDPRGMWRVIGSAAPAVLPLIRRVAMEGRKGPDRPGDDGEAVMPPGMAVAEFPPAELIVRPLFPNVSWTVSEGDALVTRSRSSLPGLPVGGTAGLGGSAVLVALLLPAVQQAREAARRSQSANNLKQIGLALHNYADTHGSFPRGTVESETLPPEERLSWMYEMLPFIEQAALYDRMKENAKQSWNAPANAAAVATVIPTYINPSYPKPPMEDGAAVTCYVGLAGLGEDGPTLPVTSPKAGVFAYDRVTKFRDILDGTSNTVMVADGTTLGSDQVGPWAQGGPSTIRPLTQKPYINGPDGIGSPHTGGCNMLFADGSVRFISENIDPTVMEALVTIRGGEIVTAP